MIPSSQLGVDRSEEKRQKESEFIKLTSSVVEVGQPCSQPQFLHILPDIPPSLLRKKPHPFSSEEEFPACKGFGVDGSVEMDSRCLMKSSTSSKDGDSTMVAGIRENESEDLVKDIRGKGGERSGRERSRKSHALGGGGRDGRKEEGKR